MYKHWGAAVILADALTDFALPAVEGQRALSDEVGVAEWRASLNRRRLWLGERAYEVTMIGTSSEISNTWVWSQVNPGYGISYPAVSAILPGCAKGHGAGTPEPSMESFSLGSATDYGTRPGSAVVFFAAWLSGTPTIYAAPYSDGMAYLAVFDLKLPAPIPGALPRLMSVYPQYSGSHRQTIGSFGAQRGLEPVRTNGGGIILIYPGGAHAHCSFDDWNRMTQVWIEQPGQA